MNKLVPLVMLALLSGSGCFLVGADGPLSPMTVHAERGVVRVLRDGDPIRVQGRYDLRPGDVIETGDGGTAALRLQDDREAFLASAAGAIVVDERTLEILRGSILTRADDPFVVRFDGGEARSGAALFRVDRGFGSTRVASYRGTVALRSPGQPPLAVDRLFEASFAGGGVTARPYRLSTPPDGWDRQHLAQVITLDEQLRGFGSGLESQVDRKRPGLGLLRAVAGEPDVSFVEGELEHRMISELLIALTIALHTAGSVEDAFARAFSLYDGGASWGVAASIMDVKSRPLLGMLDRIVDDLQPVAAGKRKGGRAVKRRATDAGDDGRGGGEGTGERGEPAPSRAQRPSDPEDDPEPTPTPSPSPTEDECDSLTECIIDDLPTMVATASGR